VRRLRAESSQKRREVGFSRTKVRECLSTRWKASRTVGGSPFTGGARDGPGRTDESETRARIRRETDQRVWRQRRVGLESTSRARKATTDVRDRNVLVQAPPVRSTRNAGGQHPRRMARKAVRRADDPTGSLPKANTLKGRAGTMVRSKRARANSAAHLPRSRQRELFWTGLGSHTER